MSANQAFDILNLVALGGWVLALSPTLPRVTKMATGADSRPAHRGVRRARSRQLEPERG